MPKRKRLFMRRQNLFARFARGIAYYSGQPAVFCIAVLMVVVWGFSGPIFGFSDTWQLIINTSTTILTFLMVFLIQNTQNHDAQVMQLKLDELIRAVKGAHTVMLDLEELSDEELLAIKKQYMQLAQQGRKELFKGKKDTGTPKLDPKQWEKI